MHTSDTVAAESVPAASAASAAAASAATAAEESTDAAGTTKKPRIKHSVSVHDRCCAKRANNERCTRRKKSDDVFCGTHAKSTPYGIVDANAADPASHQIEVWAQDIHGIIYYVDGSGNVYDTNDILYNRPNPAVIAAYVLHEGAYSIPAFNLV